MIRAMSTELWLDFLAIRLDGKKAQDVEFTMNLHTPNNGEKLVVELSNATLTSIKGVEAKNPDLTITINRADLETVMMGRTTFDNLLAAGKAKVEGDLKPLAQLKGAVIQFSLDFEIMPGTTAVSTAVAATKDPFEQSTPSQSDGG